MKIEVSAGDLKGHEIVGSDPVASIIDMGVKSNSFFVHQPVLLGEGPPLRSISDVLVRQSVRSFPEWEDAGHPAYTVLYSALRDKLAADGAKGFKDLEFGRRFLRDIVKLLYSLSTFWDNFSSRGHPLPHYFEFSSGANNYTLQKKKVRFI